MGELFGKLLHEYISPTGPRSQEAQVIFKAGKIWMDISIVQISVCRQRKLLSCLRTTSVAQLWQCLDLIMPLVTRNVLTMPCQLATCPNSQKGGSGNMAGE